MDLKIIFLWGIVMDFFFFRFFNNYFFLFFLLGFFQDFLRIFFKIFFKDFQDFLGFLGFSGAPRAANTKIALVNGIGPKPKVGSVSSLHPHCRPTAAPHCTPNHGLVWGSSCPRMRNGPHSMVGTSLCHGWRHGAIGCH